MPSALPSGPASMAPGVSSTSASRCSTARAGRRAGEVRRGEREDRVLAVAGHDDQRARADVLEHVVRLHRADRHAVDDAVEVGTRGDDAAVHAPQDHPQRRVGQDRPVRQHAQERDPVEGEAALQRPLDPRLLVDPDLVDEGARDRHPVRLEVRGVEHDLVDRPADAALGDDDRRRPEHRRDPRVRQPTTAPTPACPVPSMSQTSWSANCRWAATIGPPGPRPRRRRCSAW